MKTVRRRKPTTTRPTTALTTRVALILDGSGSMWACQDRALEAFNSLVDSIRASNKLHRQNTLVSVVSFANSHRDLVTDIHPDQVRKFTRQDYNPCGGTALFDAVGATIRRLQMHNTDANLVLVVTDGQENASTDFTALDLNRDFDRLQKTGRWTFAFNLPRGASTRFCRQFGIPSDNVREWDNTDVGTQEMEEKTSAGIGNYYVSRASGQTATPKFFTDLSAVSPLDLKNNLSDVTHRFKVYQVEKEMDIQTFTAYRTNRPYVIGSAYYQLTKAERVQAYKEILVTEKNKKVIWGGPHARALIGLPAVGEVKVSPGNHANYDVFTQSTSVNRKLVRGTRVLVDTTRTTNLTPTWASPVKA